jgi:hypothetical protein
MPKQFQFSDEAESPGSLHQNQYLIQQLKLQGKLTDYQEFTQHFPNGNLGIKFVEFLNGLNTEETDTIVDGLSSLNNPSELTIELYTEKNSVWYKMFHTVARGVGKGEILIVWLIQGATMNGGGDSYDINLNGQKFEVKDWSLLGNTSAILAGVKSKVTNFEFWNEIVDTIRRIEKLKGTADQPKFDWSQYPPEILKVMQKILDRRGFILSGECNQKDLKNFQQFYQLVSEIKHKSTGFTNLILRGPNCQPIELSIEELSPDLKQKLNINVTTQDNFTYILTELRRLKYVRNPIDMKLDMQKAVDKIVEGITYIIFRKNTINITDQFQPVTITMSSLKFREKVL